MIELNRLNKYYKVGKQKFHALKDIDLTVGDGEMVAVIGKSGAGKTTLLNILGLVDTWDSGSYTLDGTDVKSLSDRSLAKMRNEKIGFVLQDFALIEDQTVLFNVSLPLLLGNKVRFVDVKPKAISALEKVGLLDQRNKKVGQLSGGQKQRVAIARAMINEPSLILADEPTGALDTGTGLEIMELLRQRNESGTTVIIITHDEAISKSCGRIVRIGDGMLE
ncbi:MAG: ABC transporter ATP-binding protein [Clostridiales bacterium]|nr:MAG: ABC transporter ATP-binding protein [Clostridiales bacterium]